VPACPAQVLLDEEVTATMRAISVVANHRLERGIWTSPGAGDLRRAIAACEKLVLLVGGAPVGDVCDGAAARLPPLVLLVQCLTMIVDR
jgi:hypothetical protein